MEMNNVYHGDAMELINKIDDESIDLTILDPDYQDWDGLCSRGLIQQAIRVTKQTGNIICFTKQPFDFNLRNSVNQYFRREIIWSFSNGGAWVSKKMPLVSFQKLFWLTKSNEFYIDVRTGLNYGDDTKSTKRKTKVFGNYISEGKNFKMNENGTWIRDHYHFNKPHLKEIPAKPDELIQILIKCFCQENGLILDAFFGSGVTGRIAKRMNRNFIGFELNENRIQQYNQQNNQTTLF